MFERFDRDARETVRGAQAAAQRIGDPAIAPEHLLLAMLDAGSGPGCAALREHGIGAPGGTSAGAPGAAKRPRFHPASKKSLELALREAVRMRHRRISSGHILLGVLRADPGAVTALAGGPVDTRAVRATAEQRLGAAQ
ncbi:Clp protease N-terminal domain-containing protein [Nocardiopsis coralliicola]